MSDPCPTAALIAPPQSLVLADDDQFQPCPSLPRTALSLAEVVSAALCGNPQTREAWGQASGA